MDSSRIKYPRIAEGATAEIFGWDEDKILKLYHEDASSGEAEQEASHAAIAYDAGVKTPAVIDTITIDNRQGIIFERVHGVTMVEAILANPQKLVSYAHLLAELQFDVHTHTASKLPLQRQRLKHQIQSVSELALETKAAILTDLDQLQTDNAICHGDIHPVGSFNSSGGARCPAYGVRGHPPSTRQNRSKSGKLNSPIHPENILLTAEETVIIDWVDATQGSPVVDVARTALMLRVGGLPPSTDKLRRRKITEMRHRFYKAYLEHYTQICSVSRETITRWEPSVAAARLSEGIDNNEKTELLEIIKASFA